MRKEVFAKILSGGVLQKFEKVSSFQTYSKKDVCSESSDLRSEEEKMLEEIKVLFLNKERIEFNKTVKELKEKKEVVFSFFDFVKQFKLPTIICFSVKGKKRTIDIFSLVQKALYYKMFEKSTLAAGVVNLYEMCILLTDSTELVNRFAESAKIQVDVLKDFLLLIEELDKKVKFLKKHQKGNKMESADFLEVLKEIPEKYDFLSESIIKLLKNGFLEEMTNLEKIVSISEKNQSTKRKKKLRGLKID